MFCPDVFNKRENSSKKRGCYRADQLAVKYVSMKAEVYLRLLLLILEDVKEIMTPSVDTPLSLCSISPRGERVWLSCGKDGIGLF